MGAKQTTWSLETVPSMFWERIEQADGDIETFKAFLKELSEPELREVYEQFQGLSRALIRNSFDDLEPDLKAESVETLEEIANWVVTQGEAYYRSVLSNPAKFPRRADIKRPIFAGGILRVYTSQFGPWQARY